MGGYGTVKVAVFDVWGNFAHFKIPYTTSSRETYPIPPKTAIVGLIASILGFNQNEYLKWFKNNKPLVSVFYNKNSFKKARMGIKLITVKNKAVGSSPTPFFFIRKPYYTVFFTLEKDPEGIVSKLIKYLQKHKSVYHTYLGITSCLANFKYRTWVTTSKKLPNKDAIAYSPIPLSLADIRLDDEILENEYAMYKMPVSLDINRTPKEFKNFVLEKNGKGIPFLPKSSRKVYYVEHKGKTAILY